MSIVVTLPSEDEDQLVSYEEEFVRWMLEEWKDTLSDESRSEATACLSSLRTDFLNDMVIGHPALPDIVRAWTWLNLPETLDKYHRDPHLCHYVPYAMLRVQDQMTQLVRELE